MIQNVQNTVTLISNIKSSSRKAEVIGNVDNLDSTPKNEVINTKKDPIMHKGVDISKFDTADVERWDQMIKNYDPMFLSFSIVATESLDNCKPGTVSMNFYDFCSAIESGQVINEQNALNGKIVYSEQKDSLENKIMNIIDQYGQVNRDQNNKVLDIIKKCYDLGMMTKDHGLLLPSELNAIKQKQKYIEQPVFQTKQSLSNLAEKQIELQNIYKNQVIQNSYHNSI
ncbi:hypothetical protein [Rummeliibacillus sp. TYF-LIM-RU47]|uniref:hypothetical protein n=1 Tax=Rummeliibacillus sp. TYF-LIM-RU47 TaxID=2608406 RepID=UPI0012399DCE|nr:hypothetical protein [Rummeliibacillus sp. TYF-LIM-RU47]